MNTTAATAPATINAQTEGPLAYSTYLASHLFYGPASRCYVVMDTPQPHGMSEEEWNANRRLHLAARNVFDRAGRELGIDAAELAEKLDLVALIRAAIDAQESLGRMPDTEGAYRITCWKQISSVLAPFPTLAASKLP